MAENYNPLTDKDCDCLNRVLQSCPQTGSVIEKCIRCGIDMSGAKEENDRQAELARLLKAEFFPGRP